VTDRQKIPAAVFFDLDGTLVDSAPDMVVAMRRLLVERGRPAQGAEAIKHVVSKGGRAMIRRGFQDATGEQIETLLPRFLQLYAEAIADHAALYAGMDIVLDKLESRGIAWGIVTNKPGSLARSLLAALRLDSRCAALVAGDCLPQKKPDPAPILRACELARVDPTHCVYVGDDARDIEAGHAAGMRAFAAGWGYLDGEDPAQWSSDGVIAAPTDLLAVFGLEEA
jgi:phosphoglycolate phosphatase